MESNNDDDGGDEHQQLWMWNGLTNDEDKPATGEEDQSCSNRKNHEDGNDLLDLELESLSREELINLVRKERAKTMEAAKKEIEESANRQAEEVSQRIVQLQQEKAEVHAELGKKMAKIRDLHKEVEEKSEELAEKANEINTLHVQLIKAIREEQQQLMPPQQPMKVQLSLEIWYDWLGFVPRRRLGQVVPEIGDLRFASIVQKFLHEYREISIDHIEIVLDPNGPRVIIWDEEHERQIILKMAEAQMPANITNFNSITLSYFDRSVLRFMRKFQQNGLLDNVTLEFSSSLSKDKIQPVFCHLLPLVNGIDTVHLEDSVQLVDIYNTGNNEEIHEMNMKMMEQTKLLSVSYDCYDYVSLETNKTELYCRWLYQTARADGKPRVLVVYSGLDVGCAPLYRFIDRLKQDFLMATKAATFFIRINLPENFQPQEDIYLDNDKTDERFLTKTEVVALPDWDDELKEIVLLISRYPRVSAKKWIVDNQAEVSSWAYDDTDRTISLAEEMKVVAI